MGLPAAQRQVPGIRATEEVEDLSQAAGRQVEQAFQFLQRKDYIQEREGYLMGEVIADGIIREVPLYAGLRPLSRPWTGPLGSPVWRCHAVALVTDLMRSLTSVTFFSVQVGFTEFAETINGRIAQVCTCFPSHIPEIGACLNMVLFSHAMCVWSVSVTMDVAPSSRKDELARLAVTAAGARARGGALSPFEDVQVAFIIGLGETFNGDILTQLAEHPVKAMILAGFITAASLPPVFDARTEDRRGIALFNSLVPVSVRDTALSLFSSTGADKVTPAPTRGSLTLRSRGAVRCAYAPVQVLLGKIH
jgi:hypothetical protein